MKRHLITILAFTGLFFSCIHDEKAIYLKAEKIKGITTKANVTLNGFEIGQVDEISLNKHGKFLIKLRFDKQPEIPIDSKFLIENRNLLGLKGISVQLGEENETIEIGDTIELKEEPHLFQSDSILNKVQEIFEHFTEPNQQDSILIELRRLNKNLEELKKEK
ncbi:MCE family protein [Mangrovivirga sp. M17]|uniref:MCE family protein n=1 Tax=Mangrovivirga halotolerans TaxID=2993936 RepID=A0ABT3RQB9_9BACT|nr:MCE family protein [Mangrovivirga halotolerans]MCX2743365.1 MCE family protein [Mangrovivirga halotolerans]